MTDSTQIQGTQESPVTQTPVEEQPQQAPMPSANQDEVTKEESTVQAPDQGEDDIALPEEVSERTRQQFEKLKARYEKKLQDAIAQQTQPEQPKSPYTSVYDTFRPQQPAAPVHPVQQEGAFGFSNLTQQQVDNITQQFVDQEGNVDINGLNRALNTANQQAQQALQRAAQAEERLMRFEENQQVRDAHSKHPELDPTSTTFDPKFFDLVRDRLLRNIYEAKQQTLLDVANDIRTFYQPAKPVNLEKVKEEAVTQYREAQQARVQGPIEAGKGESRVPQITPEELRERTRKENPFRSSPTLDERLRNVGVIKKD